MPEPWDKYLNRVDDRGFVAHGLQFIVTGDPEKACKDGTGFAMFSHREVMRLRRSVKGGKLPPELSRILHSVKRILGGEAESCWVRESAEPDRRKPQEQVGLFDKRG